MNNNDLSKQIQDNVQFCLSLKELIHKGVDKEIIDTLLEKLCIRAESIEKNIKHLLIAKYSLISYQVF